MSKGKIDESRILKFYRQVPAQEKLELPCPVNRITLTNKNPGLGDTVIITHLQRIATAHGQREYIYSGSRFFAPLMEFNPYYEAGLTPFMAVADVLNATYSLGNGHFIQRLQRAYGFEPELLPRGCIEVPGAETVSGRVVFHFEPGNTIEWQRNLFHPRPREVYPENMEILQQFVNGHPEMEFYEVGLRWSGLRGVGNWTNLPLDESIRNMATCEYFIGIISGPLHLAIALGLKAVTIINFPDPTRIYMPVLKDIAQVESEWFYPQSVLLHEDGEGEMVPRFGLLNLERAINGELYPYWSDRYLSLINERL